MRVLECRSKALSERSLRHGVGLPRQRENTLAVQAGLAVGPNGSARRRLLGEAANHRDELRGLVAEHVGVERLGCGEAVQLRDE